MSAEQWKINFFTYKSEEIEAIEGSQHRSLAHDVIAVDINSKN